MSMNEQRCNVTAWRITTVFGCSSWRSASEMSRVRLGETVGGQREIAARGARTVLRRGRHRCQLARLAVQLCQVQENNIASAGPWI